MPTQTSNVENCVIVDPSQKYCLCIASFIFQAIGMHQNIVVPRYVIRTVYPYDVDGDQVSSTFGSAYLVTLLLGG